MRMPTEIEVLDAILRTRLAAFIRKSFGTVDPGAKYLHNWHIDLIAEYLEACSRREIKRLIINIPPRSMKSICVSVAWPAWLLGHEPSQRIMAASYSDGLSSKHSIDCRLIIRSPWYQRIFPKVQLTDDQDTKKKFVTSARGHRIATSVGGTATGDGGNFLIVDDPLNPAQAASEVERKTSNEWFDQTFVSRLDDKKNGVIVVVMQRLHENDLTGHLLNKGGWEHLCLPAVAETKTIIDFGRVKITRNEGDILHPSREDAEAIARQKVEIGSVAFAGQYQQRPSPAEGSIFQIGWFEKRYEKRQDVYKRIVQSWDTAIKDGQLNDPTCGLVLGERDDGVWDLLHVAVRRLQYPDLKSLVVSTAIDWAADAVLIEDKGSGQQLLQDLRRDTQLPVIAIMPKGDKITRASAISAMVEAGRVRLPASATWLTDFMHEILHFPNGAHDDQVDALSQFLDWLKGNVAAKLRIRRL